jgi:hypothetical protein
MTVAKADWPSQSLVRISAPLSLLLMLLFFCLGLTCTNTRKVCGDPEGLSSEWSILPADPYRRPRMKTNKDGALCLAQAFTPASSGKFSNDGQL